ncbi:putative zinc knuckle transcription factor (CnjB) [Aspergillus affinis]|uniref:putative zinc knuckle transcription factor (CnjB) n=1 Tax=Aspergillus affinis TaxID=1070780 RepID=UPI0022FE1D63|nr:uncharacterized protein KD926_008933 [Aspergillus affinis]KAI9039947.1 hypothetical protein KD926_008933 [Aspergillus affinis]
MSWNPGGAEWTPNDPGFGNVENVNPGGFKPSSDYGGDYFGGGDEKPYKGADDNKCRNCGSDDHFARMCPEPNKGMACFNCGEEGHSKAECTAPRKAMACFNCGEEGHAKVDCAKPRVFKGTCRICNQEGHPAVECPERPPDVCKNCKMEGHPTKDCTENRKFDTNHIPDKLPEEAWDAIITASVKRDLEDFREAINIYSKAVPQATFVDIENKLREDDLNFHLIAMERQVEDCISLIDLQGKLNCTYVVGLFYSAKPQRAHLRERWPASVEDNLERLGDAGLPFDRQVPKCRNCGEMGHTTRGCKQEYVAPDFEKVEVKCVNCSAVGHRARDCTEPRVDPFACRNCGSPEHKASDCPNPRTAEGVECRRCNEVGHFAKDCPQASAPRTCRNCGSEDHIARDCDQPRDVSTVTCRNCDEVGHFSRECTKKKDWSRVKCNNCGEMGHTIKRCPTAGESGEMDTVNTENNDYGGGADSWNPGATESYDQPEPTDGSGGGWGTGAAISSTWD